MRFDSPSRWNPKEVSGDAAVTSHDCKVYGWFYARTNGTLTLPQPGVELNGVEIVVVNNGPEAHVITCSNGYPGDLSELTLATGQTTMLVCGPVGFNKYCWAVMGGTAA
ncbi:MAG TPA: hypothetical protein VK463_09645 [Desulfomonilaceae bacterium]|nr:hypothetical protein [Desulfomonilaceae bacterium]